MLDWPSFYIPPDFLTGPALSGTIVKNAGFPAMMYGIGIINLLYAPLLYGLRCPPPTVVDEHQVSFSRMTF